MKTLVLITDNFPYFSPTETGFIAPELEHLSKQFDRVILAPRLKPSGDLDGINIPKNFSISHSLVIYGSIKNKLKGVLNNLRPILYDLKHTSAKLRKIMAYSAYVGISLDNIRKLIRKEKLDLSSTLFYTFWFDFTTAAFSLLPDAQVVTRTHGHDLYEEEYFISPWWRRKSLNKAKAIFTVARSAHKYLVEKYPDHSHKIMVSRLGTAEPSSSVASSKNGDSNEGISLLGIARLSEEKGIRRQLRLIIDYARLHPDTPINYFHIGDGPLREEIERLATEAPSNLQIKLRGALRNHEVHKILSSQYFDAIILLSHSEGGCPIALCEAISYGVPGIGSNVGGIPEIFEHGGGVIIPDNNITLSLFEKSLEEVLSKNKEFRMEARRIWEKKFKADILRKEFASTISSFVN